MIFFDKLIAMHFGIALSNNNTFNDIVKGSMMFWPAFSSGMQSWYSKKCFWGSFGCLGTKIVPICIFSQRYKFVMWCGFSFFQAGFVGCVRDLKLNEVPSQSSSHSVGVTPCYQQPLQPGVYFSSQGGYLTIGEPIDQTHLRLNSEKWCTAHLVYCTSLSC